MITISMAIKVALIASALIGSSHCTRIAIKNEMNATLAIRCVMGDVDIGNRTLEHNEVYSWSFAPEYFGSSRFDCTYYCEGEEKVFCAFNGDNQNNYFASHVFWTICPNEVTMDMSLGKFEPVPVIKCDKIAEDAEKRNCNRGIHLDN